MEDSPEQPDQKWCGIVEVDWVEFFGWWKRTILYFVAAAVVWVAVWLLIGDDAGVPNGHLFALALTVSIAALFGQLVRPLHLPPLLGMLLAGLALRNIPMMRVASAIDLDWSVGIRGIALSVILTRGGMGLEVGALRRHAAGVLRLAAGPNLVEALTAACMLVWLLDFPWVWGFLTGFVLSAVSPAVVVPSLLKLQEEGLGVAEGIPTLVLAAASFDDSLSFVGFGVCLATALPDDSSAPVVNLAWKVPLEIVLGIVVGVVLGCVTCWIGPRPVQGSEDVEKAGFFRAGVLVVFAIIVVLGGRAIEFGGGGALATIVLGFVAKQGWNMAAFERLSKSDRESWIVRAIHFPRWLRSIYRPSSADQQDIELASVTPATDSPQTSLPREPSSANDVGEAAGKVLKQIWVIAEPCLFALIGSAVDVRDIKPIYVEAAIATIAMGLLTRTLAAFSLVWGKGISWRERLFVALAFSPKATVQAAIGSVALDLAIKTDAPDIDKQRALVVLTAAVLIILVTAPLGAVAIAIAGPRLLSKPQTSTP